MNSGVVEVKEKNQTAMDIASTLVMLYAEQLRNE